MCFTVNMTFVNYIKEIPVLDTKNLILAVPTKEKTNTKIAKIWHYQ